MKNLKYLFLLPILTLFIGCEAKVGIESKDNESKITAKTLYRGYFRAGLYDISYSNHNYLLWRSSNDGNLIHSESCPCKGNK